MKLELGQNKNSRFDEHRNSRDKACLVSTTVHAILIHLTFSVFQPFATTHHFPKTFPIPKNGIPY